MDVVTSILNLLRYPFSDITVLAESPGYLFKKNVLSWQDVYTPSITRKVMGVLKA